MTDVVRALQDALGDGAVLTGDDVTSRSAGIWRRDTLKAKALVRPRSTEELSTAMAICHAHNQSVIAQGGLTGLVHGADTTPDDVVVSLERMNAIEEINTIDRTMTVQAGVVLQTVQEQADEHGLLYPLDLGGRGSATIGGNISTNAGGNRVIRYGMTRDMVLGLEAVLADGTVVSSLNQMIKNNAGYDLKQLFVGTEGSLGIVTRAVLRLREKPRSQETMLVAVDEFGKLARFFKTIDGALGGMLSAFEVLWNNYYTLVTTKPATHQPPLPQTYPYYVLVEAMGGDPEADHGRVETALMAAYEEELVADAVIAQSEAQRREMWAIRDDVEQTQRLGHVFTFDVSLRVSLMEQYVDTVNARLGEAYPDFQNITFGHMGDGNLHFVVAVGERGQEHRERVERCVYEPLSEIGGSVSAEHGVGLEKKPYLQLSRSQTEIDLMRTIKSALDPKGILNPGKIFDCEVRT
ncbi:MAG: FAD-binding oxidoreductase [Gammaproteobacteria bacterium]|nr:MAG: FAD-binding oxidoreductase [Gammaproteobacteria bacterium]TDJ39410.1 MAG: FAD-binding oxidoreductase [Gammaproteobacteria bacterium]